MIEDADVDIIFGTVCSTVTGISSIYAGYRNVTIFTVSSADPLLDDKSIYTNLIRAGLPTFNTFGKAIIGVLDHFKWSKVSLLVRDSALCGYGVKSLESILRERRDLILVEKISVLSSDTADDIETFLRRIKQRARIIIICLSQGQMRTSMEKARILGMTADKYVFLYYDRTSSSFTTTPWGNITGRDNQKELKDNFVSFVQITTRDLSGPEVDHFRTEVPKLSAQSPFYETLYLNNSWRAIKNSIFGYDVAYTLCHVLNETIALGESYRDIDWMMKVSSNKVFSTRFGSLAMDSQGDRIPDYTFWYYVSGDDEYKPIMDIILTTSNGKSVRIVEQQKILWPTKDNIPPLDAPKCGFRNEFCPPESTNNIAVFVAVVASLIIILVIVIISVLIYKKKKLEAELQQMLWKIDIKDVQMSNHGAFSLLNLSMKSFKSEVSDVSKITMTKQVYTKVGVYKNLTVSVKTIDFPKSSLNLNRFKLMELKQMKEMNHGNINSFVGLSFENNKAHILWTYCSKGSLQDILENDDIALDNLFKKSLISDLASGMNYIHSSSLKFHGNLSSGCCLIDSRWTLKISSFGLYDLKNIRFQSNIRDSTTGEYEAYRKLLWHAPELLREHLTNYTELTLPMGSQGGDVYSFGIILWEIIHRGMPFFNCELTPKEIVEKIKAENGEPFRPVSPKGIELQDDEVKFSSLMIDCWNENAHSRPHCGKIAKRVKSILGGKGSNIMDVMLQRLEKYANNLEEIVTSRTKELVEEKKKTDSLLYRMLPSTVAEKLKMGEAIEAEIFQSATVFFSDVVGFTSLSSESTPMEIVTLLNDLYSLFDGILNQYDVYKVETIGDAYMVVSGIPRKNGNKHSIEIANMALALLGSVYTFKIKHRQDLKLQLRIGVHTGSCAAGVVGLIMPRYCLFGDTVNTASRMETTGEAFKIHVSTYFKEHLELAAPNSYEMESRGTVFVKGKGDMQTFWLIEKREK
ncbi:DgyrCDS12964 [Dimorphilus gyrociliatus]|uniref:Guanylate cyclase n=1 Tax=Dimorphilus gyrociliatus TaxID=2664684 RepID=A0A7I8W9C1_9ANNE|nr:DgyrCDS12964 [Dimorphilus gyrociliatus]